MNTETSQETTDKPDTSKQEEENKDDNNFYEVEEDPAYYEYGIYKKHRWEH